MERQGGRVWLELQITSPPEKRPRVLSRPERRRWSSSPTATSSISGSRRSSSRSATRGCGCCLQRLDPRPDPAGAEGSELVVDVATTATSRRPCTGTGCGSTTATTEPTRPRRRSPVGGSFTLPGALPRPRRLLVPPAHPRGLRPGDGPLRQRRRRARRPGLLAARQPRGRAHPRRRPARGRQDRALQPRRDDPLGDGPLRQRDAGQRRDRPRAQRAAGEVVRFYFTNTANTRVFNVELPGARMKLVGGDSGRFEREEFVDDVDARALGAGRRRRALRPSRAS